MANDMINSLTFGSDTHTFTLPYGVCSTAADTVIKTVTVDNFALQTGAMVAVKFTYKNSAASPQLNVNGKGAKNICRYGTTKASTSDATTGWRAGAIILFVYDGTNWIRTFWENSTYGTATTSTKGLVLSGNDITVASDGKVSVNQTTPTELGTDGSTHDLNTLYVAGKNKFWNLSSNGVYNNTPLGNSKSVRIGLNTYPISSSAFVQEAFVSGQKYYRVSTNSSTQDEMSWGEWRLMPSIPGTDSIGSTTQPIYYSSSNQTFVPCTHTLGASVPANAKFTDTTSFTITATATDDDVVVLTGTNGTNKVTFDAKHAKKGPSSGYTSGNTTTSISGSAGSGTIKIPQLTVDAYGHVTAAADESVTITMPTLPTDFVKSGSGAKAGLVPKPSTTAGTTKYLREDGTWQVPPDTNTTYTLSSFGITATATELNYTDGVTSSIQTQLNNKLPLSGGTVTGNILFSNSSTQPGQPNLKWKTIKNNKDEDKTPFIGYCTASTDGTFMVASLEGTSYTTGLAIGGSSGNLLWKSKTVATTDQIPTGFTITATATDDDVVVLTGTNGTNKVTFDAKHAAQGPSSGYTSGNTTTSISGSGASAKIKIPQITVNKYGHVTAAADEEITITMPTLPTNYAKTNAANSFAASNTFNSTTTFKGNIILDSALYGAALPSSTTDGQLYFMEDNSPSLPSGGATNQILVSDASGNAKWHSVAKSTDTSKRYLVNTGSASGLDYVESVYTQDNVLFGAAWNDYAEFRAQKEIIEPGYCVASNDNGQVYKTTEKYQACDGIVSDTYGFAIGETKESNTPLAVAGRVLAYFEGNREDYHAGDTVCAGPNGKICKMTREEIREWPDRIIGIVSEIPQYETWGENNIKVNNRIWIKIK